MAWHDRYKQEQVYVQQEDNHNKFWAAVIDEKTYTATIRWGRLGTKGQNQTKDFSGMYGAADFVEGKVREKTRKGYRKITKTEFDRLCIEAVIVGTQNKCGALQWVEVHDINKFSYTKCDENRLQDPDCNPGIVVTVETKKAYGGRNEFTLLFTFDKSYDLDTKTLITKASPFYDLTEKVEEAIGRSLSA